MTDQLTTALNRIEKASAKTDAELRKANEMLGKTEAKLLATEEKCEKLSTHMKSEISRQVGDIEATEAAQRKQTDDIRVELEDKLIQIEKLKDKILEEKTKFEEQGEVIIGLKDEIYAANK